MSESRSARETAGKRVAFGSPAKKPESARKRPLKSSLKRRRRSSKSSGFRETIFSDKWLSQQREFVEQNRVFDQNAVPEAQVRARRSGFGDTRGRVGPSGGDWLSNFGEEAGAPKREFISRKERMKRSVVRNLLDSSNSFYIREVQRQRREHSRELARQIQENRQRRQRRRQEEIAYDLRLEKKIRKGGPDQTGASSTSAFCTKAPTTRKCAST